MENEIDKIDSKLHEAQLYLSTAREILPAGREILAHLQHVSRMVKEAQDLLPPKKDEIFPGDMVMVYDHVSTTWRQATVVCRYGKSIHYSDLVDIEFDHRPGKVSEGHFTNGIERALRNINGKRDLPRN